MICIGAIAYAQPSAATLDPLILSNQTSEKSFAGHVYVLRDDKQKHDFTNIISDLNAGRLTSRIHNDTVIALGSEGVPYWIIVSVKNTSSNDIWNLDFGTTMNGRLGFAMKSILYDTASRRTFFNTNSADDSSLRAVQLLSSKIPIKIASGQSGYLILYVQGIKGTYSTISPSFRAAVYMPTTWFDLLVSPRFFFLFASFGLLGSFFMKRNYAFLTTSAMWMMMFMYCSAVDAIYLLDSSFGVLITPGLWLLISILLIISLWLVPGSRDELPSSLFIGSSIFLIVIGLLGAILSPFEPTVGLILSYSPILISSILTYFLSWPFILARRGENYAGLALISLIFFVSSLWMALIDFDLLSGEDFFAHLYYWLLSLTAFASSILQITLSYQPARTVKLRNKFRSKSQSTLQAQSEPLEGGFNIREARETSEHKRLLHVLNQERAIMKDLQLQEVRRTEEMRKAKEAADEANRAKSAFLAIVSHEIRTPMTGVMGMVRLMLDTTLSKEQKEYASTIQDSSEALIALLNDILDFEKIESGKLDLEQIDFDFKRLLRGIHTLMNGHAASKNIDLILDMDQSLPDHVIGDPIRLRQVILNLVNNAIKFTPKGIVRLQAKNLSAVEGAQNGINQIYFGVQDSGIGINAETQKKLFMPFAQADSSINRKFGGTGLGLAICKRLIEAMGGTIGINSREGEGSTFFFTLSLPLGHGTDETSPVKINPILSGLSDRKLKILVVDDNGINQKVLQGLLGKNGHEVTLAGTGEQAVEFAKSQSFDLILMDIELPGKNGLEATHDIRNFNDSTLSLVPIVAMTGNVAREDVERCLEAGMDDFLGKPVMPEQLQQIILKTLRGSFANTDVKMLRVQKLMQEDRNSAFLENTGVQSNIREQEFSEDFSQLQDGVDTTEGDDSFASAVRQFEEENINNSAVSDFSPEVSDLDETMLKSLLQSLGLEQTRDLLLSFYEKTEELLRDIETANTAHDYKNLRARAHELKGMAGNFGFKTLSSIAAQLELAGKGEADDKIGEAASSISAVYKSSRGQIDTWLEQKK